MGRPRRPYNGMEIIELGHDRWMDSLVPGTNVRLKRRWESQLKSLRYRTPNGVHDPSTHLLVLSTLMTINPDIELRAGNLVKYLNDEVPNFFWDVITVGRVLADLCEYIEDAMGGKGLGLLEAGVDYKGNFYRLHYNPDTARVAYALHADLEKLSALEMSERDRGKKPTRLETPLLECPSVRGEWVVPDDEAAAG